VRRYTISITDDALADRFEAWAEQHGYGNRSEAIRDLLRERLGREDLQSTPAQRCVAAVSYVYDHHQRDLGQKLVQRQHEHPALTVSTLHVHLDHAWCMEVAILQGAHAAVMNQAQALVAERGVHHGQIHAVPLPGLAHHAHHPNHLDHWTSEAP